MHFLMVTTFYPPSHFGGDAVYVRALSRALASAGHRVEVVHSEDAYRAAGGRAPPNGACADDGIVVHRLRSPWGPLAPLWSHQTGGPGPLRARLADLLGAGFDVIHFHNVSLIGGPDVLAMGHARAKLLTLHDHWLVCPMHVLWKNAERACDRPACFACALRSRRPPQLWRHGDALARGLEHVDALLASSEWSRHRHRDGGIARPIELLPLYSRFDGSAPAVPAPARPRFLYVGRVTASKGVGPLVDAFAALPEFDLDVVGDGDLRASLAGSSRRGNVRFHGNVDHDALASLYAGAIATVVPSLAPESFGLVAVESFAFGTPVVALDAGGLGEVVRGSGGGIVCEGIDDLVAALRRIATDPALRAALGAQGRAAYEKSYAERVHVAAYLARVEAHLSAS